MCEQDWESQLSQSEVCNNELNIYSYACADNQTYINSFYS